MELGGWKFEVNEIDLDFDGDIDYIVRHTHYDTDPYISVLIGEKGTAEKSGEKGTEKRGQANNTMTGGGGRRKGDRQIIL